MQIAKHSIILIISRTPKYSLLCFTYNCKKAWACVAFSFHCLQFSKHKIDCLAAPETSRPQHGLSGDWALANTRSGTRRSNNFVLLLYCYRNIIFWKYNVCWMIRFSLVRESILLDVKIFIPVEQSGIFPYFVGQIRFTDSRIRLYNSLLFVDSWPHYKKIIIT